MQEKQKNSDKSGDGDKKSKEHKPPESHGKAAIIVGGIILVLALFVFGAAQNYHGKLGIGENKNKNI